MQPFTAKTCTLPVERILFRRWLGKVKYNKRMNENQGGIAINREDNWFQLDTAANLYPAIVSYRQVSIFRLCCTLTETIDPEILQSALYLTLQRHPSFNVRLKRGAFWNYFENNTNVAKVTEETGSPCQLIELKQNDDFLFRVTWFRNRINLEIFHALSDGGGGLEFLKTLVYYYLNLQGKCISTDGMIRTLETKADSEEIENSFFRYYNPAVNKPQPPEEKALHIQGKALPMNHLRIVQGIIPVDQTLALARSEQASLTEYLTAVLFKSFFAALPADTDPTAMVKISIPVNLRNHFPSRTMRNFSFYVYTGIRFQDRELPLDQLIQQVQSQLREMARPENLQPRINPDVSYTQNAAMRIVPLEAKNKLIKQVHRLVGEDLFTCSLSNLGAVQLPESMLPFISQFDFTLSSSERIPTNCSMCSYQNTLVITFVSNIEERTVERTFFRILAEQGLEIKIDSNEN